MITYIMCTRYCVKYLPLQVGSAGLHTPSARHSLKLEPFSVYPVSHVKVAMLVKTVLEDKSTIPLVGFGRDPQSTTAWM